MLVKNIKFINDKIEVVLEDRSFFISKENYIENPVAINSILDENRINYLLEQEFVITSKNELIKLLSRKVLSEKNIRLKLKEKGLKDVFVKKIMDSLSRMGLINDEYFCEVFISNLLMKKKGKREIIKQLEKEGVDRNIYLKQIENIEEDIYLNNFNKVYSKYLKMYDNKSYKLKEKMIIDKLKEYGYEEELINSISFDKNEENELENARAQLNKIIKSKKINLNNYENINKIKTKLVIKGFSYDIINRVVEEVKNNEID